MPDRLALVKGPPAGSRNHLDGFCAALWPSRGEARRRYSRALAQRNSLLGRIRAGAAARGRSLDAWDLELATAGVELSADPRRRRVERLAPAVRRAPPRRSGSPSDAALALPPAQRGDRGARRSRPSSPSAARATRPRLHRLGPAPRRARARGRRPLAAPLRLPGPAARRAAGAAVRRAPHAARRRPPGAADAARRRHLRARRRPPAAAGRAPRRRRRAGADHRDRARPTARAGRAPRDRDPRRAPARAAPRPASERHDPARAAAAARRRRSRAVRDRGRSRRRCWPRSRRCWREAIGERVAAEARPVRERDGVITVECRAATWAQELDLMQDELLARLNAALGGARVARSALRRRRESRPRFTLVRDLQVFYV